MATHYNPSLRESKRSELAPVLPLRKNSSILNWLEGTGRLLERENKESRKLDEDEEEITALMGADDNYEDEEEDDDLDDDLDD